jgi:hypothetical protein
MTEQLASEIWEKEKEYYNSFDLIIVSDTAPLSRIFLQNDYKGKLIIWVCNRFDYADHASCEKHENGEYVFPDNAYYALINSINERDNVKIFSYTKFEHEYAEKYRNTKWKGETIKPCSFEDIIVENSGFPSSICKQDTFFITRYHNDNILLNLKAKCDDLKIPNYRGEYHGASDLKGIKGIIHIPYAWSNFAIFENFALNNVYFIPTKRFLFELADSGDFFWSPPFDRSLIESSEWYLPEHSDLFIFFNDWEDLRNKTHNSALIAKTKSNIKKFSQYHTHKTLFDWSKAFDNW